MSCDIETGLLPLDIQTIVMKIAQEEGIVKPVLTIRNNGNREGAMGSLYFISVKDDENTKSLDLAVKNSPTDPNNIASDIINKTYSNEVFFYQDLWPAFRDLQETFLGRRKFKAIPKCYSAVISNRESHKIVLEDLTKSGFHTLNKREFFDEKHMELVLKEYGKFHAFSFCLKTKSPEKFLEFSKNFTNVFLKMKKVTLFVECMRLIFRQCFDFFSNDPDEELRNIVKHYSENGVSIYFACQESIDENLVFNHGDCWSNNIMFKHNACGEPAEIKFIDFQQTTATSPVFDLSYCIYSSAAADILDNLDHYLKVYHRSLSDTLEGFGLDVMDIYPFETLKSEWKKYCKFGYSMALLLLKQKLMYKDVEIIELTEKVEENIDLESFEKGKYDKKLLEQQVRHLVRHMYTNKFF